MKTIEDVGRLLAKRYDANRAKFLRGLCLGEEFVFETALNPNRKEAASDIVRFRRDFLNWTNTEKQLAPGVELRFREVSWKELGLSRVPSHVCVKTLTAAFELMPQGASRSRSFVAAQDRFALVRECADETVALALAGEDKVMFEASGAEFERLLSVVLWLRDHPAADCFIRELPIEGVDTKWLENNRAMTARVLSIVLGEPISSEGIVARWRLKVPPVLVRVRHAARFVPGLNPEDFVALPLSVFARAKVEKFCIVENLQTGLALDVPDDVPVICGMGNAIRSLRQLDTLNEATIFYMGDLDQHGLRILASLRASFGSVQSVLMNCATLEKFRHLAVNDPTEPIAMPAEGLAAGELKLFEELQNSRLRLEQERIPMSVISRAFVEALKGTS